MMKPMKTTCSKLFRFVYIGICVCVYILRMSKFVQKFLCTFGIISEWYVVIRK